MPSRCGCRPDREVQLPNLPLHLQQNVWWACRSPSQVLIGLEGGQAEESVEHLLLLGQLVGDVDGEAGLEVGGLDGADETTALSKSWIAGAESTETLPSVC